MRIADNMTAALTREHLAGQQQALMENQLVATSGQRVNVASDDPAVAAAVVALDAEQARAVGYRQNLSRAEGELEVADSALGGISELLQEAYERALGMANDIVSTEDRQQAADEISGIVDRVIAHANSRHGSVYIFGGYLTADAPFDASGTYLGDAAQRQVEADDGLKLDAGVSGASALTSAGGEDVFAALQGLVTALQADDGAAISDSAVSIDSARDQVVRSRATVGQQMSRIVGQQDALSERIDLTKARRSRMIEADAVEALSQLMMAQQALNRTIQVSARMLSTLSLADRL